LCRPRRDARGPAKFRPGMVAKVRVVWLACEYIVNYHDFVWNTHVQQLTVNG